MKIEEVLPYFIKKVNTEEEFKDLQVKLFSEGYKWINDMYIFTHKMIKYPIFISNIPDDIFTKKTTRIRNKYQEYKNNIIFFEEHTITTSYDKKILRKTKLNNLTFH